MSCLQAIPSRLSSSFSPSPVPPPQIFLEAHVILPGSTTASGGQEREWDSGNRPSSFGSIRRGCGGWMWEGCCPTRGKAAWADPEPH
ncbi:hypothetical protein CLOP_g16858 [Closterium sp. NIES-67]|nr:hypothetical protein CLOP_g16858 [Closterium sp. NIES-67]